MKTFEFIISENFATSFNIKANTEGEAREKFEQNGYDEKNIKRECTYCTIEGVEEVKQRG